MVYLPCLPLILRVYWVTKKTEETTPHPSTVWIEVNSSVDAILPTRKCGKQIVQKRDEAAPAMGSFMEQV